MFGVFVVDGSEEPVEKFDTGREAADKARALNAISAEAGGDLRFKVRPIVDNSWKERERMKMSFGPYVRLPEEVDLIVQAKHPDHFAHASQSKLGFIAFTESPEKGMQDRQTRKRAGAYLREFFPLMGDSEVQRLALICDNEAQPRILETARGADAFEQVYRNGPHSCMAYSCLSYASYVHPVRAYEGPDLAIGWIEDSNHEITGRAILWPDKMRHGLIYGDVERMAQALENAGYERGELDGARMDKLEDPDRGSGIYVMPYIDDAYAVTDAGAYFEICANGEINADRIDGLSGNLECSNCGYEIDTDEVSYVESAPYCPDCCSWCEQCEETVLECTWAAGVSVCDFCLNDNFTACDECGEYTEDSEIVNHQHGQHCEDCFNDHFKCCVTCGDAEPIDGVFRTEDGDPYCEAHASELDEDSDESF